jgi:hypothetical protein
MKELFAALVLAAVDPTPTPTPRPTEWPLISAGERADHDLDMRGPWPQDLPFPEGMSRYRRSFYTQEIAVVNSRDRITPVSRLHRDLKSRWLQSGGLEGISGWRSDLYCNEAASKSPAYIGNIQVRNEYGYYQPNRGFRREFKEGSRFLDVLSNTKTGKVFEVRQRLKEDGKWASRTLFEDVKARPSGYEGLQMRCSDCHNSSDGPGTGGYAAGLVPGSDTVFSLPFAGLEQ